jgi:transcriptional regulator with XRE-family HTH domain
MSQQSSADAEQPGAPDPDDYRIPTIDELDAMRVAAGLSMKDLSDCAGFKSNRFSHILNNDTNPQTRTIRAFLTALQAFDGHSPSGEQGPDPEPSELVDDGSDGPTEVDVDRIAARLRRLDPDAVGEDPTPPDADENLLTDGGQVDRDSEKYYTVGPEGMRLIGAANSTEYGHIVVCPDGHVHVVVGESEITLSPNHAERWVEILYDAAQEAQSINDETGRADGGAS